MEEEKLLKPNRFGEFRRCLVVDRKLFPEYGTHSNGLSSFESVLNQTCLHEPLRSSFDLNASLGVTDYRVKVFAISGGRLCMQSYASSFTTLLNNYFAVLLNGGDIADDALRAWGDSLVALKHKTSFSTLLYLEEACFALLDLNNGVFLTFDEKVQENLFKFLGEHKSKKTRRLDTVTI